MSMKKGIIGNDVSYHTVREIFGTDSTTICHIYPDIIYPTETINEDMIRIIEYIRDMYKVDEKYKYIEAHIMFCNKQIEFMYEYSGNLTNVTVRIIFKKSNQITLNLITDRYSLPLPMKISKFKWNGNEFVE